MLQAPHVEEETEPPGDPRESPWPIRPLPASEPPGDPRTPPWPDEAESDD